MDGKKTPPMQSLARDFVKIKMDRAEVEYDEEGQPAGVFGQHFIGWDPAIASDSNADYTFEDDSYNEYSDIINKKFPHTEYSNKIDYSIYGL